MKRRSFLRSAAVLPFAGFDPTAFASAPTMVTGDDPQVVPAGKDRLEERHTLGFSTILFKVLPRETSNGLFVIEHLNLVKGGPPLHKHFHQDEYFYVMEGVVRFALGDKRLTLRAGDSVLGPRGIPHTFAGVEGKPSHMLISFAPAGRMEQYFRDSTAAKRPVQDAAYFRNYEMELVGPSPFA